MQQISNKKVLSSLVIFISSFWANIANAVCPVCVVAVGAGLGFSRWLKIDDVVSSIWIGALLVAVTMWTIIEMKKHNWRFPFDVIIISLAYYILTLVPLFTYEIIGHPLNKIFGIDKIVFGVFLGTIVFILSYWLHNFLKKENGGKSFFQYQKVVMPLLFLLLTSLVFYFLSIWKII